MRRFDEKYGQHEPLKRAFMEATAKEVEEFVEEYAAAERSRLLSQAGVPTDEFSVHEAFVTAMKIDPEKPTYDHLQEAFSWMYVRMSSALLQEREKAVEKFCQNAINVIRSKGGVVQEKDYNNSAVEHLAEWIGSKAFPISISPCERERHDSEIEDAAARISELERLISEEPRNKTSLPPFAQRLWESCVSLSEKTEFKNIIRHIEGLEKRIELHDKEMEDFADYIKEEGWIYHNRIEWARGDFASPDVISTSALLARFREDEQKRKTETNNNPTI